MGTVSEILKRKHGTSLRYARPDETVLAATQQMNEYGIGALLVLDQDRLVGIFTERDVLRRVVAAEVSPATVHVADVMTKEVACCVPETTIDEARRIFSQHRIRHLPVVNVEGEIQGLISIGDLNAYHASSQEVTIHYMHEYLLGRV
jgi:CBS domain-containing protein